MNLPYCIPVEDIKLLSEKSIINNFKNTSTLCRSFRNIYPMYNSSKISSILS